VDVVDHDRRGKSGQEGCGVQVGAGGFCREAERCATMSRKENLGEIGFPDASWAVDYEKRW
jgi:hypothetical protein